MPLSGRVDGEEEDLQHELRFYPQGGEKHV
jgi:hypothetical protein